MIKEVIKEHPSKASVYDMGEKIVMKHKLLTFGGNTEGSCLFSRYMFSVFSLCTCDWPQPKVRFSRKELLLSHAGPSTTVLLLF